MHKFDMTDFIQGALAGTGAAAFVMIILTLVAAWQARKRKGSRSGPDSDDKMNDSDET